MNEIQKADPGARRLALLLLAAGTLVGVAAILGAEHLRAPLRDWLLAEPGRLAQRLSWIVLGLGAAAALPALLAAAHLWRVARKAARAHRFPPPGQKVLRDTPVLLGAAAVARARRLRVAALVACAGVVAVVLVAWRLVSVAGPPGG